MTKRPHQYSYQYTVLRCVPRADREESVNVGVVLYCQAERFLALASHVDEDRVRVLDRTLDLAQVRAALEFAAGVCAGNGRSGAAAEASLGTRFGFLSAPRSTVVRPGPVHGGVTDDPARELQALLERLVR